MKRKIVKLFGSCYKVVLSFLVVAFVANYSTYRSFAQNIIEWRMSGDQLNTIFGLPWAAQRWPFSQLIEVQVNNIDSTRLGWVVLDRHGFDDSSEYVSNPFNTLIKAPFASPLPGRVVIITAWGSINPGCYVEIILQAALPPSAGEADILVPRTLEMNIDGRLVRLRSQSNGARYSNAVQFQYTDYVYSQESNQYEEISQNGVWYTGRHLFLVDASSANILSNATVADIPLRVTLSNGFPFTYPIGQETVRRWQNVFRYNPSCS